MSTVNYGGRIVPASTPLHVLVRMDAQPDSAPVSTQEGTK